jgi:hypothetical protein
MELKKRFVDIEAVDSGAQRRLRFCVSSFHTIREVLSLAAKRLQMANAGWKMDTLQIRREGDLLPLDGKELAGCVLCSGDRLIVERSAGSGRRMVAGDDGFRTAAAKIAGSAVSADSETFLKYARQPSGE